MTNTLIIKLSDETKRRFTFGSDRPISEVIAEIEDATGLDAIEFWVLP
jgi:hypothetical protein